VDYDRYNREERALCSHLFRLLHEHLATAPEKSPLRRVLGMLASHGLTFSATPAPDLACRLASAAILTEVALIRDAYQIRKPDVAPFMDAFVALVARQEGIGVGEVRLYSALPPVLGDPRLTHPKQIAAKARNGGALLSAAELRVYGAVQAMFNAKPDIAIVLPTCFIVFEAKFTEDFDQSQLARTRKIAGVWATLLHADLGFQRPPPFAIAKLGDGACGVDLSWQELLPVARETYAPGDRSRAAFEHAVEFLGRRRAGPVM
jgi:hypothetical protein